MKNPFVEFIKQALTKAPIGEPRPADPEIPYELGKLFEKAPMGSRRRPPGPSWLRKRPIGGSTPSP